MSEIKINEAGRISYREQGKKTVFLPLCFEEGMAVFPIRDREQRRQYGLKVTVPLVDLIELELARCRKLLELIESD